jgi:hypothetical protein
MDGACSTNKGEGNRLLVGKPKGRRPLGRLDNVEMDFGEIG